MDLSAGTTEGGAASMRVIPDLTLPDFGWHSLAGVEGCGVANTVVFASSLGFV